jgi:hypothetical protein
MRISRMPFSSAPIILALAAVVMVLPPGPPAKCAARPPVEAGSGAQRVVTLPAGTRCTWRPGSEHLRRGDPDFHGNGSDVEVRAQLQTDADGSHLFVVLTLNAKETGGDGTIISGSSPLSPGFALYSAPKGYRIVAYSPTQKESYRRVDTGPEVDVMEPKLLYAGSPPWNTAQARLVRGNLQRFTTHVDLVQRWEVVGDVAGPDLGQMSVTATLYPIRITLQQR